MTMRKIATSTEEGKTQTEEFKNLTDLIKPRKKLMQT